MQTHLDSAERDALTKARVFASFIEHTLFYLRSRRWIDSNLDEAAILQLLREMGASLTTVESMLRKFVGVAISSILVLLYTIRAV